MLILHPQHPRSIRFSATRCKRGSARDQRYGSGILRQRSRASDRQSCWSDCATTHRRNLQARTCTRICTTCCACVRSIGTDIDRKTYFYYGAQSHESISPGPHHRISATTVRSRRATTKFDCVRFTTTGKAVSRFGCRPLPLPAAPLIAIRLRKLGASVQCSFRASAPEDRSRVRGPGAREHRRTVPHLACRVTGQLPKSCRRLLRLPHADGLCSTPFPSCSF